MKEYNNGPISRLFLPRIYHALTVSDLETNLSIVKPTIAIFPPGFSFRDYAYIQLDEAKFRFLGDYSTPDFDIEWNDKAEGMNEDDYKKFQRYINPQIPKLFLKKGLICDDEKDLNVSLVMLDILKKLPLEEGLKMINLGIVYHKNNLYLCDYDLESKIKKRRFVKEKSRGIYPGLIPAPVM